MRQLSLLFFLSVHSFLFSQEEKRGEMLLNEPRFLGEAQELIQHFENSLYLDLMLDIKSDTLVVSILVDGAGAVEPVKIYRNTFNISTDTLTNSIRSMPPWFPAHDMSYRPVPKPVKIGIVIHENRVEAVLFLEDEPIE